MSSNSKNSQQHAFGWLAHGAIGEQLLAKITLHQKIKASLARIIPTNLMSQCEVVRLDSNYLILSVPTSAFSSKIRQLTPRIKEHLHSLGWLVQEVVVKVQANENNWQRLPTETSSKPEIDEKGMNAFSSLADKLHDENLKNAVQRLLNRRK